MADPKRLPQAFTRLVPKRGTNDCAVAAIASFLGRDYEEVLIAASRANKDIWRDGLTGKHHVSVCSRLGVKTRWFRKFDLEDDTGVLWLSYNDSHQRHHSVLLIEGKIYDPDYSPICMADCDEYLRFMNAFPAELLKKVEA